MPYGTISVDTIAPTSNLSVTGDFYSPNMPGRNRIINGAMAIDQRNAGAAQTITAAAALAYTVDRWYAYCTGANVTGQRVAGSGGNLYAYRFTGAASVTAIGFGQRIEALNSADLAGTTATLSVELSNSLLTTVTWTAYYANTADTFGTLASPTRTQIATGTFTVTSTLTRYTTNISIPAAATTGIEIVFTVGAQTSGTWTIDNVQLESGSVATPFERRTFSQELNLCQRYFYSTFPLGTAPAQNISTCYYTFSTTVSNFLIGFTFPVQMRTTPNITTYNPYTTNASFRVPAGSDVAVTAGGVSAASIGTWTCTLAAPSGAHGNFAASAEL